MLPTSDNVMCTLLEAKDSSQFEAPEEMNKGCVPSAELYGQPNDMVGIDDIEGVNSRASRPQENDVIIPHIVARGYVVVAPSSLNVDAHTTIQEEEVMEAKPVAVKDWVTNFSDSFCQGGPETLIGPGVQATHGDGNDMVQWFKNKTFEGTSFGNLQ
ncbi:hypothetical protein V6N13_130653 [Hibiscus sabdariffa]|uniref:Uncharacterized protein n=2 Tax=Hibiscus sabdariffa TaxID=183260 RepID=A0ABR2P0C5_9ROSI